MNILDKSLQRGRHLAHLEFCRIQKCSRGIPIWVRICRVFVLLISKLALKIDIAWQYYSGCHICIIQMVYALQGVPVLVKKLLMITE